MAAESGQTPKRASAGAAHDAGNDAARQRVRGAVDEVMRQLLESPLEGGLYLVATPIGNLSDITLRAIATIVLADFLYCEDKRHSAKLLQRFGVARPLDTYHEHNARRMRGKILEQLATGASVAIVSDAGTPLVSDPGFKLVREAVDAGFRVIPLPGPTAALAALTASGLPTDAFLFCGFLPPRRPARRSRLEGFRSASATLIFYEAPHRIADVLDDMRDVLGDRFAAVGRELTKLNEDVRRGRLSELALWAKAAPARGEYCVIVGPCEVEAPKQTDIEAALCDALGDMSVRDASRMVAERFGLPRGVVYDMAVALRRRDADPGSP